MRYRGRKLRVTINRTRAKYELLDGDPLQATHNGRPFEIGQKPMEHEIPRLHPGPRPEQPPGRAPYSRSNS
jgi:alpha,alpha-trehalose phosphorylase